MATGMSLVVHPSALLCENLRNLRIELVFSIRPGMSLVVHPWALLCENLRNLRIELVFSIRPGMSLVVHPWALLCENLRNLRIELVFSIRRNARATIPCERLRLLPATASGHKTDQQTGRQPHPEQFDAQCPAVP